MRELLTTQGQLMHLALRVGPEDSETWKHTTEDLDSIAPPLVRILNRYEVTRAAAVMGDEMALAAAVGKYGVRNYVRMRRLQAQRAAEVEDIPVSGVRAEPGTGPEDDPDYAQPGATVTQMPDGPPRTRGSRVR